MELIFPIILTVGLLAVVAFDVTKFIIPNWLNLAFIAVYPVYLLLAPEPPQWWLSLAVMAAFFAIGYLIFALNIMGGGDIKLLIALSLWIGYQPQVLAAFLFWTAISGGVLSVFLLVARFMAKQLKMEKQMPKVFQNKAPVPYGLAIAYAFGYLLWKGLVI